MCLFENLERQPWRKFGPFVDVCYLLYAQAVLQLPFSDQIYSRVQGPLVLAGKDDVGSIEPGHLGDFVINVTPAGTRDGKVKR